MPLAVDVYGHAFVPALTAGQAAALDERAREDAGIPERLLMENAGRAAALLIQSSFPEGSVIAAAGPGNNGGDALVALRILASWGREVGVVLAGSAQPRPALLHGHDVTVVGEPAAAFARAGVLVDGILGTGARGEPRAPAAGIIEAMNGSGRPIVALDLPSGVAADTGAVPGAAIQADLTICFGAPKIGLLFQPGRSRCGRLVAVEIGFPPVRNDEYGARLITPDWASATLPTRPPNAHKGSAGKLMVLAGGRGMGGAAILSARGALRAGAGLIYLATYDGNRPAAHTAVPDAILIDRDSDEIGERARECDAVVAGPGLGRDESARRALRVALEALPEDRPALLDADAVTLLARDGELAAASGARPTVITPHPGEFARMSGAEIEDVTSDPVRHAREQARELGCAVLLKGLPSVVATPDGMVRIDTTGSSDLASAGMGDHLAGVIGAMLAAGAGPADAAALGLFFSGRAADLAGLGRSLSPWDVGETLSSAFERPGALRSATGLPFVTFEQPARR